MNETPDANSDQVARSPLPLGAAVEPRYKRVGGWLLLFCLGLTVFTPLITLGSLAASYSESSQYFDRFPGLLVITVIDTLLSLSLMAFSIYAGVGLWSIRCGAVQTAKRYLACFLGYHAIAAALPFMAGLPAAANEAMTDQIIKDTIKGAVYFAVWYSYLNKSKRVKATYGQGNGPLGAEEEGYELLQGALKLERRGRIQEALSAYEHVAQRYAQTAAGNDAQKSVESLRAKIA